MRRQKDIWLEISSWENLLVAWQSARKGKRFKRDVLSFHQHWEEHLIDIQNRLIWGMWEPTPFASFVIYEPKQRVIEAPRFGDRVVHHALHQVVEPFFERRFIDDSYACRRGKGTHAAVASVQRHLRRAQQNWGQVYVLQADIKGYFHHIQHDRLMRQIGRVIGDKKVLHLWSKIIRYNGYNGVGLPIGSLTSQLGANIYLDALDHHCKDDLGIKHYARYMDDWVILGQSKEELHSLKDHLKYWLYRELGLSLSKWSIYPASQGVDFSGYRTWATHIKPRKRNIKNARRRLKGLASGYAAGRVGAVELRASLASYVGYTKYCESRTTVDGLINDVHERLKHA
ncbi:alpha/beta hydrolase [Natronospirillum operosum]|uniref:Alpha/beta hydrolase n=1 Tax=Natronospirillum operosum TaxID=2759953 RepID=A0A4Z0W4V0_9GAMM|nr:reverse transcriptase/maturase family protein [Natronospirillum operosum]TGG92547.1 alpha/beta hydrolase [Natronospirillum operosum]